MFCKASGIITSAKEVMFYRVFVCLFVSNLATTNWIFEQKMIKFWKSPVSVFRCGHFFARFFNIARESIVPQSGSSHCKNWSESSWKCYVLDVSLEQGNLSTNFGSPLDPEFGPRSGLWIWTRFDLMEVCTLW